MDLQWALSWFRNMFLVFMLELIHLMQVELWKMLSKNSVKTMIFTISPWCKIQRNQSFSWSKMSFHGALHSHVMILLMLLNCETPLSCNNKEDNSKYNASCFIFINICVLFTKRKCVCYVIFLFIFETQLNISSHYAYNAWKVVLLEFLVFSKHLSEVL